MDPRDLKTGASPNGQRFGRYQLLKRLAVGGMAEVFLARLEAAKGFEKPVVLKVVKPDLLGDPHFVDLFLDEGRLAARLDHPNIGHTFDLGDVGGRYFIAMEYVVGETLVSLSARAHERSRRMPLGCAVEVASQLLDALAYVHTLTDEHGKNLGIIHRDVSPNNVMVTYQGRVKLLDFGIARASTQWHQSRPDRVLGKLGYMAPEQCRSAAKHDARIDVFAAGAVLYTMVCNRGPYFRSRGVAYTQLFQDMAEARFPLPSAVEPSVPGWLEAIIGRAMERNPDHRFSSASEMGLALEKAVAAARLPSTQRLLGEYVTSLFEERAPFARRAQSADVTELIRFIESVEPKDLRGDEPPTEKHEV